MKRINVVLGTVLSGYLLSLAQFKPDPSTSKIRNVLIYDNIAGWFDVDGEWPINNIVPQLGAMYGFNVVETDQVNDLTPSYLAEFEVLIWNNNTDGGGSVPTQSARQALLDYIDNGGGWLPVHGAGNHGNTWTELADLIGTDYSRHGVLGNGTLSWDSEALADRELSVMLEGHNPSNSPLYEEWYSFNNSPRNQTGVHIIANVSGAGNVVLPLNQPDPNGTQPVIWAREVGNHKGKMIYTSIGGVRDIYTQQNNFARDLLYDHMRYVANDFNFGCMTSGALSFDPEARIHDQNMCLAVGVKLEGRRLNQRKLHQLQSGLVTLKVPYENDYTVKVTNIKGANILTKEGRGPSDIEMNLAPGVHMLVIENGGNKESIKMLVM